MNWTDEDFSKRSLKGTGSRLCLIFIVGSFSLLAYVCYVSEFVYDGALRSIYLKYYIAAIIAISFWSLALFNLTEDRKKSLVTIAISVLVGLYICESFLSSPILRNLTDSRAQAARDIGVEYDVRSRLEVVRDNIADGTDTVPTFHPSSILNSEQFSELIPLSGKSHSTTVYKNESGKYLIYQSDRYGFNNPDEVWDSEKISWLLIGDSFVHGAAVQPGEELAALLRKKSGTQGISIGIGGNGPLLEYASLIEFGDLLKPKIVIWFYYENDLIVDLPLEKTNSFLRQYLNDDFNQNLADRQDEIDTAISSYVNDALDNQKGQFRRWLELSNLRKLLKINHSEEPIPKLDHIDPIFTEILTKAKYHVTEKLGGKFYFVFLPTFKRYSQKIIDQDDFLRKKEILEITSKLGISSVDIHREVFENHPDPLSLFPLRIDGHYNQQGYEAIATALLKFIPEIKPDSDVK